MMIVKSRKFYLLLGINLLKVRLEDIHRHPIIETDSLRYLKCCLSRSKLRLNWKHRWLDWYAIELEIIVTCNEVLLEPILQKLNVILDFDFSSLILSFFLVFFINLQGVVYSFKAKRNNILFDFLLELLNS